MHVPSSLKKLTLTKVAVPTSSTSSSTLTTLTFGLLIVNFGQNKTTETMEKMKATDVEMIVLIYTGSIFARSLKIVQTGQILNTL